MRSKPILAAVLFALVTLTLHGQAPVFSPPQGAASTNSTSPQIFNGQIHTPQLVVGVAAVTALQTVRGIVAASYGLSNSNGTPFLDIFPVGYNPWPAGIRFEDGATDTNAPAVELGLTADGLTSQHIRFISQRTSTFDNVLDLYAQSGALIYAAGLDGFRLGQPNTSAGFEAGYGARFGYDATNQNALLNGGGSVSGAGVGAGLSINSPTFAATYAFYCDTNGNCGVGTQKKNATLDNWFVTPAGAETTVSTKIGTGTVLARYARYNGAFSPVAVAANTCAAQSFTVTGVVVGDILIGVNKPTEQAGLSVTPGHVTGANAATMNFCNNTASPITPTAAEAYNLVVVQ